MVGFYFALNTLELRELALKVKVHLVHVVMEGLFDVTHAQPPQVARLINIWNVLELHSLGQWLQKFQLERVLLDARGYL